MSTLSLRLPTSLHRHLRVLAEREGVSINQLINAAIGEKVAALATLEYLQNRARRGSRVAFQAVLAKCPTASQLRGTNCLTPGWTRRTGRARAQPMCTRVAAPLAPRGAGEPQPLPT